SNVVVALPSEPIPESLVSAARTAAAVEISTPTGDGAELPRWLRSILAEATNPVPPHLRAPSPLAIERVPPAPRELRITSGLGPSGLA
ncbi:MAG: hypothetical protein L3K02_07025, partial [Thermoplasmata archaeon]|nr:hypothetical protein [Thermoplasmata archaeon]